MPSNTYLLEFTSSSPPSSIKAGYCNLRVELYVPNPLRCYKCQKFGHGSRACRGLMACVNCSENDHESIDCNEEPKCTNCSGNHKASSKQCPSFIKESAILKIKYENNISFADARRRFTASTSSNRPTYASTVRLVTKFLFPVRQTSPG